MTSGSSISSLNVSTKNPDLDSRRPDSRHALEVGLSRVDDQLVQLLQKRNSLRRILNDWLCPALRLPVEISTEIFMYYLQETGNGSISPFRLAGRIYQAWRDLVWSTPKLWNTVTLDLEHHLNCGLLNEWLIRSAEQTIDLIWVVKDVEDLERDSEASKASLNLFRDVMHLLTRFTRSMACYQALPLRA